MQEPDLLKIFAVPLSEENLCYLVAGSLGAMHYSEPRLTLDIDLAVAIPAERLSELRRRFPEPDFYTPPEDILASEIQRDCRAHFSIIHLPTGLKADFYPSNNDPFFAWALKNRRMVGQLAFAPPEYVIVWKVAYFAEGGSEKHVRDIAPHACPHAHRNRSSDYR